MMVYNFYRTSFLVEERTEKVITKGDNGPYQTNEKVPDDFPTRLQDVSLVLLWHGLLNFFLLLLAYLLADWYVLDFARITKQAIRLYLLGNSGRH